MEKMEKELSATQQHVRGLESASERKVREFEWERENKVARLSPQPRKSNIMLQMLLKSLKISYLFLSLLLARLRLVHHHPLPLIKIQYMLS